MAILIGTDEAGYGPNLGPLVIAASAWDVPTEASEFNLYEKLSDVVCLGNGPGEERIAIADSKQLFKQGGTLAQLELGVHAALSLRNLPPRSWRESFARLDPTSSEQLSTTPWYTAYEEAVPVDLPVDELAGQVNKLTAAMRACGISLIALRAAVIFPGPFNERVRELGSKGALLTERTLSLVREILALCPPSDAPCDGQADVIVQCDKHGGRNRYAAALQHTWPESWVQIQTEGRAKSVYEMSIDGRQAEICFAVGGESQLPAALASMRS